eukprot:22420-Eustigmatos_ZCMA.PRE.1
MPDTNSEQLLGGHAMLIVGIDLVKNVAIVRNSWSADWGDAGYAYIPLDYILDPDLAFDFYMVTHVNIISSAPKVPDKSTPAKATPKSTPKP